MSGSCFPAQRSRAGDRDLTSPQEGLQRGTGAIRSHASETRSGTASDPERDGTVPWSNPVPLNGTVSTPLMPDRTVLFGFPRGEGATRVSRG